MTDFLVKTTDLSHTASKATTAIEPADGEVVLRVERFALTANNITYGVAGDLIGYWKFFPADDGWGRIPVWGIGQVSSSRHPAIETGSRYYGYFPMSDELCVKPERINSRGFTDAAPHRAELPPVYNQYALMSQDNGFDPAFDNHYMVYRPLFTTSFVLDDYLADNGFFGATQVVLGSASSKTAFGLAYMLKQRQDIHLIGLTSATNRAFVEGLGLYDQVLTYDQVDGLAHQPTVYVDMSGNRDVLARLHHHLQDDVVNSCGVGATHWEARGGEDPGTLPGAQPSMFFAPSQIMKRTEELGAEQYQSMISEATQRFFADVDQWVHIETHPFSDIEDVYRTVLQGPPANRAYVVTL